MAMPLDARGHFHITFGALKNWFIAQCYDSLAVAAMWLIALLILHVPFAFFWAFLGGALQFVPNLGAVLALIGPAMALLFSGASWERFIGLLIAYAAIMVIDGLILQPYLMKRQNRVPIWASILAPIVLGFIIPFWGVLLAPPLLAVIYAYRRKTPQITPGEGVVLPPERFVDQPPRRGIQ
jgi:predicted PurR-regulated permease PerM